MRLKRPKRPRRSDRGTTTRAGGRRTSCSWVSWPSGPAGLELLWLLGGWDFSSCCRNPIRPQKTMRDSQPMVLKGTHAVTCLTGRPFSVVGGTLRATTPVSLFQIGRHCVGLETTTRLSFAWEVCYLQSCDISDIILEDEGCKD